MEAARIARFTNRSARNRRASVPFARAHAWLYRASGGRLAPRWFGAPVLVLETVGRRSGQPRATPVLFVAAAKAIRWSWPRTPAPAARPPGG